MSPIGPSAPSSMPSYSCCAIRIVTAAENPSCFAASCCSVLVRNGGGAARRRSPFSTVVTVNGDRKSTRLNSSHSQISYAVFCLKKKNIHRHRQLHVGYVLHLAYVGSDSAHQLPCGNSNLPTATIHFLNSMNWLIDDGSGRVSCF